MACLLCVVWSFAAWPFDIMSIQCKDIVILSNVQSSTCRDRKLESNSPLAQVYMQVAWLVVGNAAAMGVAQPHIDVTQTL